MDLNRFCPAKQYFESHGILLRFLVCCVSFPTTWKMVENSIVIDMYLLANQVFELIKIVIIR